MILTVFSRIRSIDEIPPVMRKEFERIGMDRAVAIMNGTYVRGFYRSPEGALLYVHPGSGLWNGFPIRVGVPSEIAVIRLERRV